MIRVALTILQTPQQLLLIDLVGAVMTSLVTALILASGMLPTGLPAWVLYALAFAAACFAGFDIATYMLAPGKTWPLAIIGLLNLCYCIVVAAICAVYQEALTWLGLIYFALESALVIPLACWEIHVAIRTTS